MVSMSNEVSGSTCLNLSRGAYYARFATKVLTDWSKNGHFDVTGLILTVFWVAFGRLRIFVMVVRLIFWGLWAQSFAWRPIWSRHWKSEMRRRESAEIDQSSQYKQKRLNWYGEIWRRRDEEHRVVCWSSDTTPEGVSYQEISRVVPDVSL